MSAPILGCRLSAAEYAEVMDGYARAAAGYTATAVVEDDRARIDVCGPKVPIKALLDEMIAREGGCCAHFHFDVSEITDGYQVELSMPSAPGIAAVAVRQAVPIFFPTATIVDGTALETVPTIERDELTVLLDRGEPVILVEVLPTMSYRKAHLPGALNLPLELFDRDVSILLPDMDAAIVVYCANLVCKNSSIVTARLIELGYTNVRDYAGGKQDWIDAGLPVE